MPQLVPAVWLYKNLLLSKDFTNGLPQRVYVPPFLFCTHRPQPRPPRSLCKEGGAEASLLCNCVFGGEYGLLRRLLRAGAHVDQGDYDLRTPLHIAAGEAGPCSASSMWVGPGRPCRMGPAVRKTRLDSCRGDILCALAMRTHLTPFPGATPVPLQPRAACPRWSCW